MRGKSSNWLLGVLIPTTYILGGKSMKYYAVKVGRKKGIYNTWDECRKQVYGFSGAKYKSYENLNDAKKYLEDKREVSKNAEIYAYVDGSYDEGVGKYAYGCVILKNKKIICTLNGSDTDSR